MSRRVELVPLGVIHVHGAPVAFTDLRIGGTTIRLTREEAAAAEAELRGWRAGLDGVAAALAVETEEEEHPGPSPEQEWAWDLREDDARGRALGDER